MLDMMSDQSSVPDGRNFHSNFKCLHSIHLLGLGFGLSPCITGAKLEAFRLEGPLFKGKVFFAIGVRASLDSRLP